MVVLTPQQEAKHWRIAAQAKSLHALLQTFRGRRSDLKDKLTHIDQQIASEQSRGKVVSPAMHDEIELLKAPTIREMAALEVEEGRVTAEWHEASKLAQALDRYVKTLERSG